MFQIANEQTIVVFPLFMGSLAILLALFNRPLMRFMGLKPLSERFTTPHFQRSAKINERLGRLFLVVMGIGFLLQGAGPLFLPDEVTRAATIASAVLAVLIVLAMIGVVIANWKAE